jgi:hypothetical protein
MVARSAGARKPAPAEPPSALVTASQAVAAARPAVPSAPWRSEQPIEHHDPLADDQVFEPEVPAILLLVGRTQGPGRLGDLMRSARRP